jgi:NAD(P)-dependent dehydrogenase (short-subunit alcohol dehydrogenase family)
MAAEPPGMFSLEERVAIVTGASSGLGARFAEALATAGASVVLAARRRERIEKLADDLCAQGAEAIAVACDVTSDGEVAALVSTTVSHFGTVDVLANNAGVAPDEDAANETPASFRRVLDLNLNGAYACAREAAGVMLKAGRGSIVNTASISGLVAGDGPDTPSYVASKGGLIALTRELAVRWAEGGVRVNALAPGYFPTEMTETTLDSEHGRQFIAARTPMGRPGRIEELDGALIFLASDASSYVTGITMPVDGGWTAR